MAGFTYTFPFSFALDELITLTQAKEFIGIEDNDDDDTRLSAIILGVSAAIRQITGRGFSQAQTAEYLDGGGSVLEVAHPPIARIISLLVVRKQDQTLQNPDFDGDSTDWTLGTNWAYTDHGVLHTAGSTQALSQGITALATAGNTYILRIGLSGHSAGKLTPAIGDSQGETLSETAVTDQRIETTGGSDILTLTPNSAFDGKVDFVTLFDVTGNILTVDDRTVDEEAGLIHKFPDPWDDYWYDKDPNSGTIEPWPLHTEGYRIEYVGGDSAPPDEIEFAAKLWTQHIYQQSDLGVTSSREGDIESKIAGAVPPPVKAILTGMGYANTYF